MGRYSVGTWLRLGALGVGESCGAGPGEGASPGASSGAAGGVTRRWLVMQLYPGAV